jgi:two-component system response regulator HydG
MPARVLIVDDDLATSRLIAIGLSGEAHTVETVDCLEEALVAAKRLEPEVVVTDLNMAGGSGIDLCKRFGDIWPDVPVVVITAFGTMNAAIEAMRAGAYDFITKPFDIDALAMVVGRAYQHHALRSEVKRLRAAVGVGNWGEQLLGKSPAIVELRAILERVSGTEAPVLITGESGTGKDVIARLVHEQSLRRKGPFVVLDCSALPEAQLEAALFGKVPPAGSEFERRGAIRDARGGTLFLAEIGELSKDLQAKLLRSIEDRHVSAEDRTEDTSVDVRLVATSRRDLQQAVQDGNFRDDLLYRLSVVSISVPPLRSRGTDVLLLAQHILKRFAEQSNLGVVGVSEGAAERLVTYPWPGNIRELRNAIERGAALAPFDHIRAEDLPERVRSYEPRHVLVAGDNLDELVSLEEVERRYILKVLQAAGGNKSLAAQRLGVARRTLYRKLGEYGVDSEDGG